MTATTASTIHDLLAPVLAEAGFELVDVELHGGVLQVLVDTAPDHESGQRIDLDGVAAATRLVDAALDAGDPIPGSYTLEVSSPGLERPLRTPAHYRRFVGTTVTVKTHPGVAGDRRVEGVLADADADPDGAVTITTAIGERRISFADIERARTVFVWGAQPKPGKGPKVPKPPKPAKAAERTAQQATHEAPHESGNEGDTR